MQVESCRTRPADPGHVEGAVEILANGREIVGKREWDYVDQLWSYLATMVKDLRSRETVSAYYPDQPIKIEFARQGSRVAVASISGDMVRRASVDLLEFESVISAAGELFFGRMSELLPERAESYKLARSELIGG
ncbi:hypothetical protein OG559_05775 [Micromonospora sp. NBC_01405]|uniref:hypothetical protein n=1 Tax=Micromonospora sp. NBC_01405 TaxID=2903589 RepID=UPI0032474AFB